MTNMEKLEKIVVQIGEGLVKVENSIADLAKQQAETAETVRKMAIDFNERYGHLGDRLGEITELVVVPGVRPVMNKLGHDFDQIVSNKIIKNSKGERKAEVDLFLDNGTEAMAIEIKTRLATGMIDGHIKRLQKLRSLENYAGITHKKLYGAVAGVIIDDAAKKHALKNGLYVIEILEDEYRLNAKAPTRGKIRTW